MKYTVYSENVAFFITSDFSIGLLQCTSELQTSITFLFVNDNTKCGYAFSYKEHKEYSSWYQNYLAMLNFSFFIFCTSLFSAMYCQF